jgi:glutaredoxin
MFGVLRSEGYSERALFIIDKGCTIRYVDVHDISQQPDNDVLFAELAKLEPEGARRWQAEAAALAAAEAAARAAQPPAIEPAVDVVMYCTAWCPACRRARAYLQQYGISYKEIDITRDREAAQRVRKWANGAETTPTFEVKGSVVVEFNRPKLNELLGIQE